MPNFSDYLETALLGHTLLGSAFPVVSQTWLTLATSINSDASVFTEVTTNTGFSRKQVFWTSVVSAPNNAVQNSAAVNFDQATTPWGIIAHYVITDAATIGTGNPLYWVDLPIPRNVLAGEVIQLGTGKLTVRLD